MKVIIPKRTKANNTKAISCIFNFKDLYNSSKSWLRDQGYKVIENNYVEQIEEDSKRSEIHWIAKKKVSDYYQFVIDISWVIANLKNVEIQKNGKTIQMNSGETEVTIKAIILKDYQNDWESNSFFKFLRGIYENYITKSRDDAYSDKIRAEVIELNKYIKSFLLSSGSF